jgi:hypothetical protein
MQKVNTVDGLRRMFERYEMSSAISRHESLVIDNTNLPPEEVARQIAARYGLPLT